MTKLTIIGAGSTVFTKNIVVDLLTIKQFKSIEIALMDIDQNRLLKTKEVLEIIAKKMGATPKISLHTNRRESLLDADFVQTTFQIGGFPFSNSLTEFTNPGFGYFHRLSFSESSDHVITCNLSGTTSSWRRAQYGSGPNMATVTHSNISNSTHLAGSIIYRTS